MEKFIGFTIGRLQFMDSELSGSLTFGDIIIFPLAVRMVNLGAGWFADIMFMMVRFGLRAKHIILSFGYPILDE